MNYRLRVSLLCVVAAIGASSATAAFAVNSARDVTRASSPRAAATSGSITRVTFGNSPSAPEITVTGSGFGAAAPPANPSEPVPCRAPNPGHDYGTSLFLSDTTKGWTAGRYVPNGEFDCIGLIIDGWSDSQVAFHFDGFYAANDQLALDDQVTVSVVGITRKTTVYPGAGGVLPLGPADTSVDRTWPTAPSGGWSSMRVAVNVTRAPVTNPNAHYYYGSDWRLGVTGTPPSTRYAYKGLQTPFNGTLIAIVSIFTTSVSEANTIAMTPGKGTDGSVADCHRGTTEGPFVTCRITYAWQQGQTYRYSFARTAASHWTATITNVATNKTATLGTFTVPASWTGVQSSLTHSWIEQYSSPPETTRASDPVCPAIRTTASFTNARVNSTATPSSETPNVSPVNWWLSIPRLTCQNGTALKIANGITLDTDIPTPASVASAHLAATNGSTVTVAWTAALDPSTITANTLAFCIPYPSLLAAVSRVARPLPDSYVIKTTDEHGTAGPSATVTATQRSATITLASGHRWTLTVTATKNGSGAAPVRAGSYSPPSSGT